MELCGNHLFEDLLAVVLRVQQGLGFALAKERLHWEQLLLVKEGLPPELVHVCRRK